MKLNLEIVSLLIAAGAGAGICAAQTSPAPTPPNPPPPSQSRSAPPSSPTPASRPPVPQPPSAGTPVTPSDPADVNDLLNTVIDEGNFITEANKTLGQYEAAMANQIEKIRKANNWGNDVNFNRVTRKFEKAEPKTAAPAPEKK